MTTFFDLIVMLFWPLVSAAAAWAIAIYALAQKDEISEVVEALTGPNGVHEKRKAWRLAFPSEHKVSLRRSNLSAILSRDQVGFRFISDACGIQPNISRAKGRATKRIFLRDDDRRRDRAKARHTARPRALGVIRCHEIHRPNHSAGLSANGALRVYSPQI